MGAYPGGVFVYHFCTTPPYTMHVRCFPVGHFLACNQHCLQKSHCFPKRGQVSQTTRKWRQGKDKMQLSATFPHGIGCATLESGVHLTLPLKANAFFLVGGTERWGAMSTYPEVYLSWLNPPLKWK